jgi:hypothetical protein
MRNMKAKIMFWFVLIVFTIEANAQDLLGDWIKTKVTYADGIELSNNQVIKYSYLRYSIEKGNRIFISLDYEEKGLAYLFEINSNILQIKNSYGYLVNAFQINQATSDELILIEKGKTGFNETDCIKYYFIREKKYQDRLPMKFSDILLINGTDTVYKSSEKIHAKFLNEKSFQDFCLEKIPEKETAKSTVFLAIFIIRKTGAIDSLQILENINKTFEKQFRKAFDKSKNFWIPGELNDRKVDVQMKVTFRFLSGKQGSSNYIYSQKAKSAMDKLDFIKALAYFELAFDKVPSDYETLYLKAICEINLGNKKAACEDLEIVKESRTIQVNELIEKNCK